MSAEIEFEKAVEKIVRRNIPLTLTEGEVTAVDKDAKTCNVDRGELPELLNVRLNSILEAGDNVITVYPKKGSKVLCILIENKPTDAYLLSTNNIDEIVINNGLNGGLTRSPELKSQLEKLTARVDGIIDAINDETVIATPQDGGKALLQLLRVQIALIQDKEDFSNIENTKITH